MSTLIGALNVALGLDASGFNQGLTGAQGRAQQFQQRMVRMAARLGTMLGAALSVRGMVQAADTWSDLSARVGNAVGSMEQAPSIMQRIQQIARQSYSDLGQTAEAFISNSTALRELGYSTRQTLDYTEALNNMLVVSGARGQRAEAVQRALSVAMATGRLQGDGLNTVMANGGRVAEALAAELGTTVNGLRAAAASGRITSDVIGRAVLNAMEAVREEAANMPATVGDGITAMRNGFIALIGTFDQTLGASEGLGNFLVMLADNMQLIASFAIAAGAALVASYTPAIVAATASTAAWIASLITLRGVLISTGIGAFVVGAGLAINALLSLVRNTGGWGEALRLLGEVASGVWEGIKTGAGSIIPALNAVWLHVKAGFFSALEAMMEAWGRFLGRLADDVVDIPFFGSGLRERLLSRSGDAFEQMSRFDMYGVRATSDALIAEGEAARRVAAGFDQATAALQRLRDAITGTEDDTVDLDEVLERLGETATNTGGAGRRAMDEMSEAAREAQEQTKRGVDAVTNLFMAFGQGSDAAKRALANLIAEIARMQMMRGFQMLAAGGGGGIFGWLGGLLGGFQSGGYTGDGPVDEAAGVVHRGEYVFSKPAVSRIGPGVLEALHRQARGYMSGGLVGGRATALAFPADGPQPVYITVNVEGANGDRHVIDLVQQGVATGLRQYDRTLPVRVQDIQRQPRVR